MATDYDGIFSELRSIIFELRRQLTSLRKDGNEALRIDGKENNKERVETLIAQIDNYEERLFDLQMSASELDKTNRQKNELLRTIAQNQKIVNTYFARTSASIIFLGFIALFLFWCFPKKFNTGFGNEKKSNVIDSCLIKGKNNTNYDSSIIISNSQGTINIGSKH